LKNTQFDDEIIPTKLYPKNVNVDKINEIEIRKLKEAGNETLMYKAEATKDNIKSISKYDVELVENSQVIVTRNIDIAAGIVNGMRGIIKNLFKDSVIIKDVDGNLHNISYYTDVFDYDNAATADATDAGKSKKSAKAAKAAKAAAKSYILHMPLKVSYALSIHKSQGMTIDALEIDLGDNIFTCGQGYTALSRAKSLKCIKIIDVSKQSFKINPYVKAFYNNVNNVNNVKI
jgi:ATP-dependent DNA helicase PIF1